MLGVERVEKEPGLGGPHDQRLRSASNCDRRKTSPAFESWEV